VFNDDLQLAAQETRPVYNPTGFDRIHDSFMATFADSYTGEIVSSVNEFFSDESEKTVSGKFINEQLGLSKENKFDDNEMFTQDRANDLIKWGEAEIETDINQEVDGYSAGSFVAALAGGFVADPVIALSGTALGRVAATGIKAYRTGVSFKAAKQIMRKSKSIGQAFKSEIAENLVATTLLDVPAMKHLRDRRNQEFEAREALTMIAGSTLAGTALSLGIGKVRGDFKADINVEKKVLNVEEKFGSDAPEVVDAEMKYQDSAREYGSNTKNGHTEEMYSESTLNTRKHQTPHVHEKVGLDNISGKKFYIGRKAGDMNFNEVSNNGIGTVTLTSNKNVVENKIQGLDGESHGSVIEIEADDLKLVDGESIGDDIKVELDKLGVDSSKIDTVQDAITKMIEKRVDAPKEKLAQIVRKLGYDGYVREIDLPNGSKDNALTLVRDDVFQTSKNNADVDDATLSDGISTRSNKLNITNERKLNPYKTLEESFKDTNARVERLANEELNRMKDPSRNGTYVNMKDLNTKTEYEEVLDTAIDSLSGVDETVKGSFENAAKIDADTFNTAAADCKVGQ
jgi:hypothetical protein